MSDVAVVGAGIVGAWCAYRLAQAGLSVTVYDPAVSLGATGAGMGHVALMDDSPAQFDLCLRSQELWKQAADEMGDAVTERIRCGATWLASTDAELAECRAKVERYEGRAELWDQAELRRREPNLAHTFLGACHVPGDWVAFQPRVTGWLLERSGARLLRERRTSLPIADWVVLATGAETGLLPDWLPIQPRKGHLAITTKGLDLCSSQVIDLGYMASAHGGGSESVAFNIQPRPGGQYMIGSSRQFGETEKQRDSHVLQGVLEAAARLLPKAADAPIIRTWTGFRPALPDHLPAIGALPDAPRTVIATGHEGLGITTAPATAEHVVNLITNGTRPPEELRPERFLA